MNIKVAIIAALSGEPDGVMCGRTLLQKKLYFISVLTSEDFGYGPYFYGPYSSVVSAELGALEAAGFVIEHTESLGGTDEFGDVRRYSYTLGNGAELFLDRQPDDAARYRSALERINQGQVPKSQKLLSMAAKVNLILAGHDGTTTVQEIREEAKALKWVLDEKDILGVEKYLEGLGLVELSPASA